MSRKKQQRRVPQVPRSSVGNAAPKTPAPDNGEPVVAQTRAEFMAEEYSYVKNDLMRITLFGGLIIAAMIALKLVGL